MYIYNVTVNIEKSVKDEWLKWIKHHIAVVLATGHFTEAKFSEVITDEEVHGYTYSIQYRAKTREDLDNYYKNHAERLRKDALEKFADKALAFRTELRIIDEFSVTYN
ncbi:MAG: hypothetical protein BM564_06325 [Bacteroidetes bacterium MedPE-SWsnd-G2]|nr:MAG: hypothetical protein BM564_06325 [Bacteroidetes bacterium MedPE-SWsnd-G2]